MIIKIRLVGPLLDRIDMHIEVPNIKFENFENTKEETSQQIKERVNKAREIQKRRYEEYGIFSNGELTSKLIEIFCTLRASSKKILEKYFIKNSLSARSYSRILKVARTIADLDESEKIEDIHILEALRYRALDKK